MDSCSFSLWRLSFCFDSWMFSSLEFFSSSLRFLFSFSRWRMMFFSWICFFMGFCLSFFSPAFFPLLSAAYPPVGSLFRVDLVLRGAELSVVFSCFWSASSDSMLRSLSFDPNVIYDSSARSNDSSVLFLFSSMATATFSFSGDWLLSDSAVFLLSGSTATFFVVRSLFPGSSSSVTLSSTALLSSSLPVSFGFSRSSLLLTSSSMCLSTGSGLSSILGC